VKPKLLIGIVFIVLGVAALAYHGITYTTHEKVLQIGPIEATKKTEKTIPLPPLLGGAVVAAGIILVILGARKS
jgi:amino acid transporter